jgi:pimeloyl-ACP methyl ester carboxylesterase
MVKGASFRYRKMKGFVVAEHIVDLPAGPKTLVTEGRGPVLLVVHGGPGMDYSYMVKGLAEAGKSRTLVYYEQTPVRGTSIEGASAQRQVEELAGIVGHLAQAENGPVGLLAHSWGTYLALELVREDAGGISHLVLVNPAPLTWERLGAAGERLVSRVQPEHISEVERLEAVGTEEAGLVVIQLIGSAYVAPEFRHKIFPRFDRYNPAVNAAVLGSVEGYDQISITSRFGNAALSLIYGDSDFLLPGDTAELQPFARHVVTLSNCGHFPFDEQPAALIEALNVGLS